MAREFYMKLLEETSNSYNKFVKKLSNYNQFKEKLSKGKDLTEKELQNAIKNGFDVNEKGEDGHTLCMWAAWFGKTDTVKVLKKQGADVNAQDDFGRTACMWAARNDQIEMVRVLVKELKADVNAQDNFGYTACMWAARNGETEALLELVRLGADISIENNERYIVLDYIDDNDTKKKVLELRREYEENHPDKPKMADDLAKMYLPHAVKPAFRGSHTAKRGGAKKAAARDNVPQK